MVQGKREREREREREPSRGSVKPPFVWKTWHHEIADGSYYSLFQKDLQSGLALKKYEDKGNLDNKVHRMAC